MHTKGGRGCASPPKSRFPTTEGETGKPALHTLIPIVENIWFTRVRQWGVGERTRSGWKVETGVEVENRYINNCTICRANLMYPNSTPLRVSTRFGRLYGL